MASSIVQNYIEQRAVDLQTAVYSSGIVNEAQLPEPVHEEADTGTSGSYHVRQGFLTDLRDHRFRNPLFAEMSQQQKHAGQSLLAGIEKLVDEILFVADIARQQIRYEHFGKRGLAMQCIHHRLLIHPQNLAIRHGGCGAHTQELPCQRTLAKKVPFTHDGDRRFLAGLGYDGEPHFAFLDVEHGVRPVALGEDQLLFWNGQDLPTIANRGEESVGVESALLPGCRRRTH